MRVLSCLLGRASAESFFSRELFTLHLVFQHCVFGS
uniref:Uncharacterized protein n=1 Tax=Rhizophora mucronata TaxID=61149 RepID=A0A2P2QRQ3_RHIMU